MDNNTKKSLITLAWTLVITLVNGIITIFNPSTEQVAAAMFSHMFG